MGCRCDYMEPTALERESKKLIDLLKEVGIESSVTSYYGAVSNLDTNTKQLCEFCQCHDVKEYSLELQIWWRDHRLADEKRLKEEAAALKQKKDKKALLDKLTEYEKELLGL